MDGLYLRLAANDSSSLTIQLPVKDIHVIIVGRLAAACRIVGNSANDEAKRMCRVKTSHALLISP
jgi:hypothetical protein